MSKPLLAKPPRLPTAAIPAPDSLWVRARVEHVFARMKAWKILRDCRLKGAGFYHAMFGIARLHDLALAR